MKAEDTCVNCGKPIELFHVHGKYYSWTHPDLVDYNCHGTFCGDNSGEEAEPND